MEYDDKNREIQDRQKNYFGNSQSPTHPHRIGLATAFIPQDASLDEVLAAQHNLAWKTRVAAAQALARFGESIPVHTLVTVLNDKHRAVRVAALETCAAMSYHVSVALVEAALVDSDWSVRSAAAWALGFFGERAPQERLIDIVEDREEVTMVRTSAISALGILGTSSAIEYLVGILRDPDHHIRETATLALGKLGNRAPEDVLFATLDDKEKAVRLAAAVVLGYTDEDKFETSPTIELIDRETTQARAKLELGQKRKALRAGNVEFIPLVPSDLADTPPIIAQAFDNQWVPRSLLRLITDGRLIYDEIAPYVKKLVRTEYIRSLINGRSVVINRAFLYNNPVVFNDFLPGQQNREAFKALLDSGVIIPFLLAEQTPDEQPRFSTHPDGIAAWRQVCQEVLMNCVRFTWGDATAQQKAYDNLARRFHNFAATAETGDIPTYLKDFGLDAGAEEALRGRLLDLTEQCSALRRQAKGEFATREDLYNAFITADGTPPSERLYDGSKPFSAEIKQYLDLAYNVNLADALNGNLLTPNDTLPRVALQEWQRVSQQATSTKFATKAIIELARQKLFGDVQSGLYLKSMRLLSLQDVLEVRRTEEWDAYVRSLDELLKGNLLVFQRQAPEIYRNYARLMVRITDMLERRKKRESQTDFKAPWSPNAEFTIDIAGAMLSIKWTEEGRIYTFSGRERPALDENGSAPFVARLNIGDWSGSRSRADLFTSFDFMKGRLDAAQDQWEEMRSRLREIMRGKEHEDEPIKLGPTINEKVST